MRKGFFPRNQPVNGCLADAKTLGMYGEFQKRKYPCMVARFDENASAFMAALTQGRQAWRDNFSGSPERAATGFSY